VADQNLEPGWRRPRREFAWTPLVPPDPPDDERPGLYQSPVQVFLIHFKSDTDIGALANNDPLTFFRQFIPEMRIPDDGADDVRAMLLRVNAERPANPVWVRLVAAVIHGSTTVAMLHYKDENDYEGRDG
jgi:hypothetical protein